jgi:hypothetical protein
MSMSTGRRAYDLLRGFVNQEWERINLVGESPEVRELRESLELTSIKSTEKVTVRESYVEVDPKEWAQKVLGVTPGADFVEIRAAFERLHTRSDPSKFPSGSEEAAQANEIHVRVQKAYAILSEGFDSTEKRFKSLEID